jgi:adenylate kinase
MQVVLEEARSSYPSEIVVELESDGMEQLESNVTRMVEWITTWLENQENR